MTRGCLTVVTGLDRGLSIYVCGSVLRLKFVDVNDPSLDKTYSPRLNLARERESRAEPSRRLNNIIGTIDKRLKAN